MTKGRARREGVTGRLKMTTNRNRIGKLNTKLKKFDNTTTSGRTSAGNNTFLIRLPPPMIELEESNREDENQSQGNKPQPRWTT